MTGTAHRERPTALSLRASCAPVQLPSDRLCDVELAFTLTNESRDKIEIYPKAAKLAAISSYAGVGITWSLALTPAGGDTPLPLLELRRWYGPPGNPPPPGAAMQDGVSLRAGEQYVARQPACWIPNARLAPEQLAPTTIDPQGMDNVAARSWAPSPEFPLPPPLHEYFPLARASVLVLGADARSIETALHEPDVLRGHVVAFVPAAGAYDLQVAYSQTSWMGIGTTFQVRSAPVRLHVGA